ncbi:hypothetical protein [uncultured Psychroserpens sp.]|uniref:hypothetical protein n=1 Tax=uncultured Psychroserpens sp. TaxID=255436 RepID=UPI0026200FCD|nr:hypothetical protein [uncultured Psychroserpens sp.]
MKTIFTLAFLLLITSCIPIRVAPKIEHQKIMVGKKFRRTLPKAYVFIFEDPKDANEFYDYINTKFQLNNFDVDYDVPIQLNGKPYYMSFYEAEIPTKTLNLAPIVVDAALAVNQLDPLLIDHHMSRVGTWYVAISILDKESNNCLEPNYKDRTIVIDYLKCLKNEYLTTHNYIEILFKKKSIEDY